MKGAIYTIGHSSHPIEKLVGLLQAHSITAVGDVRSQPYSRMYPQFNRESLSDALSQAGTRYVYLGRELGARSDDRSCYRDRQVQFDLLARTSLFQQGIERIVEGAHSFRIALLCAEKEPLDCHRTILVARRLAEEGHQVRHILESGDVETHEHAVERLIDKLRIPRADMFRNNDAVIDDAYKRQSKAIAYREQEPQVDSNLSA